MHDVLEGVLQYQCKELMKAIIQDEKLMSLDVLNQHLKKFDYGNYNNKNKSSHITLQTLNSENNSLGQKDLLKSVP